MGKRVGDQVLSGMRAPGGEELSEARGQPQHHLGAVAKINEKRLIKDGLTLESDTLLHWDTNHSINVAIVIESYIRH